MIHLVEMVQRCVDGELAFQNLAVDHRDKSRAEIIANLDELTTPQLLVIFNRLALLTLQILILWVECRIECRL